MNVPVAVLIVNFNAGDALARCVESVLSQGRNLRVVVVDNASTDDSARRVHELYGRHENVMVVFNDHNRGFSAAVNQAAGLVRASGEPLLLVLNPDCELFPGSLRGLVDTLVADPRAAMAGPSVVDRHGAPQRGTFRRFPDPWRGFLAFTGLWRLGRYLPGFQGVEPTGALPVEVTEAEALSGACMLLKAEDFVEVGGMDEGYGLHCEDLDLMYRLSQRGRARLFVPESRVYHEQGVSSSSRLAWVHWQKHRGMQRFYCKFQAPRHFFLFRWLVIAGIWLRFLLTLPVVLLKR